MSPVVYTSAFDAGLYFAVLILWVVSFFVELSIIRSGGERRVRSRADRGSYLLITLGIFVSIPLSSIISMSRVSPLPEEFFYLGV